MLKRGNQLRIGAFRHPRLPPPFGENDVGQWLPPVAASNPAHEAAVKTAPGALGCVTERADRRCHLAQGQPDHIPGPLRIVGPGHPASGQAHSSRLQYHPLEHIAQVDAGHIAFPRQHADQQMRRILNQPIGADQVG